MPVHVEGDRDRRMTEAIGHHLRMHPSRERERCSGMAQIVQADPWKAGVPMRAEDLVSRRGPDELG